MGCDPYAWRVEVIDRDDLDHISARDGDRIASPEWTTFWDATTERFVFDPQGDAAHDWIEDDAFTPVAHEDQTCCVCGIYRTEVEG